MPPKTADDELAELAELEKLAETPAPPPKHARGARPPRQRFETEDDALKDLDELEQLGKAPQPTVPRQTSRPNTPKVASSSASSNRRAPGVATPSSTGSARTSEDNRPSAPRKSGESTRSYHQSFVPSQDEPARQPAPEPKEEKQAGGSWWGGGWGGLVSTATAAAETARKQAEAAYQELQKNQEAQRWAEQVRGNVGALRGIGTSLASTRHRPILTARRRRTRQACRAYLHKHPQHTRTANLST